MSRPAFLATTAAAAHGVTRVFSAPVRDVRAAAVRVAIIATAIVCVAYLVVAAAVILIVNRNLTTAVDNRLQDRLTYYAALAGQRMPSPGGLSAGDRSLQEPLLSWVVLDTGAVFPAQDQFSRDQALPDAARSAGAAETVSLGDGADMRAAGLPMHFSVDGVVHNARIVVAQSLTNISATQHNILTAELLIGPLLLVAVFFGAYTVGRRVGSPIERARRRQVALTADASHELRTPLSVIEAQTSLALERERDTDWYRRAFEAVGVESKRMRKLVDDLLWLARFDATRANPEAEPVDLGVLAEQATARFAAVAESRGQMLRLSVEPVSTMVSAPPEWLDRLLGVLLDNACRYTPGGGSINVVVGRHDGRVRLAVEDSGPGIAPEQRARIFERFHRASDLPGGSGLGLSIAGAVVGASGGRWHVGTAGSGGATMAVSWSPLVRGSSAAERSAAVDTVISPRPPEAGRQVELRPGSGIAEPPPA